MTGHKVRHHLFRVLLACFLASACAAWSESPRDSATSAPPVRLSAKTRLFTNCLGMKLRRIEPGAFLMGSPQSHREFGFDEKPLHKVKLSRPFYLGVCEVTQDEYEALMGANPSLFKGKRLPVENVTALDAADFCKKLSEKERRTYRLPSEAEWEYACRAGGESIYPWGAHFDPAYAWCEANSRECTHEVGTRKSNRWGLHDMIGNVWEWCSDHYDCDWYEKRVEEDPKGPGERLHRVLRGGAWCDGPEFCRSAVRGNLSPHYQSFYVGFRVVLEVPEQ